jgi:hypothetical protein
MTRSTAQHHERLPVLGVDVGRVIIEAAGGPSDTSFLSGSEEAALDTPQTEGCFDSLARLNVAFESRVWIISKAGPRVAARTQRWFAHHAFFERTGISSQQVRFCRERRDKRDHCVEHAITHFVDDRMDVLRHLLGVVPALYLFGTRWTYVTPPSVQPVRNWSSAERAITATLGGLHGHPEQRNVSA